MGACRAEKADSSRVALLMLTPTTVFWACKMDDSWTRERVSDDYRYMHEGWYNSTLQYRRNRAKKTPSIEENVSAPSLAYESLESAFDFRILLLQPSEDFDAPLLGSLTQHSLHSAPKYECLSYVWGAPERTKVITVNDEVLYITPNLENILRHLRLPSQPRPLWVDAICINQCDPQERSAQVQRMQEIYMSCEKDLVWIGPYESGEYMYLELEMLERGINLMKEIESFGKEMVRGEIDEDADPSQREEWRERLKAPVWGTSGPIDPDALHLNYEEGRALQSILSFSAVWDRLWVMQEVSCAPELVLVAGPHTLNWNVISSFLGDSQVADAFHAPFSHDERKLVQIAFSTAQVIEHQRSIVQKMREGYTSTLLDVLARFRWTNATDARDKIYGLLGLVSHHSISVDYSKTTQQVYMDVALSLINDSSNLDILCQSPWSDLVYRMPDLPSWVPDFTCPGHPIPLFAQRSIFKAGPESCSVPCKVLDNRNLVIRGVCIDRISPILPDTDNVNNYKLEHKYGAKNDKLLSRENSLFTIPREWMALYFGDRMQHVKPTYVTGESSRQAFWRTLIADCKCYPIQRLSEQDISEGNTIFEALLRGEKSEDIENLTKKEPGRSIWRMWLRMIVYWTFITTEQGFFGMVMCNVREGDMIVALGGAKVPVVLREISEGTSEGEALKYQVVSTAYLHGFMDGEAYVWAQNGKLKLQEFVLG